MAEPRKVGSRWKMEVMVKGTRHSAYFDRKAEAYAWAQEIKRPGAVTGNVAGKRVRDLLDRYSEEVSVKKPGARWEQLRLALIGRMPLGEVSLDKLDASHAAQWREERLAQVSAASVRREMNLLGHAFKLATKEWRWLAQNPVSEIERPKAPAPRDRTYTDEEIARIAHVCGDGDTATARVGMAFRFAIETAMRAGEIVALQWTDVFAEQRFLRVQRGKTASAKREVPLSPAALGILSTLARTQEPVFRLTSAQLDALFRKVSKKALVADATFHDTRHTAATRMADKLDVMELAKVMGIRDLRILLGVYYNKKASDMAQKLAVTAAPPRQSSPPTPLSASSPHPHPAHG